MDKKVDEKQNKYKISQKDIDSVLNFLKITDPENATPEMAIELLEYLQATFHNMAHEDPEKLKELYEDLKREKNSKLAKTEEHPTI